MGATWGPQHVDGHDSLNDDHDDTQMINVFLLESESLEGTALILARFDWDPGLLTMKKKKYNYYFGYMALIIPYHGRGRYNRGYNFINQFFLDFDGFR